MATNGSSLHPLAPTAPAKGTDTKAECIPNDVSGQHTDPPFSWSEIRWFNLSVIVLTPLAAAYGFATTAMNPRTVVFSVLCYVVNMLGITAGYHRLWSHRAYNASLPLQIFLCLAGTGSIQGSIRWWARGHRAHHRYTDTELDPYSIARGLFWAHMGWMLVKPRIPPGQVDTRDLAKSRLIQWQSQLYFPLALIFGILLPWTIAGYGWHDWRGGLFIACFARITFVHHSTFCVNSLAHYMGETTYDDTLTPRDSFLTALLTLGEGYHNFHHQFPADYRNAPLPWQFDPTKWFIFICSQLGLASHLKRFPDNEIRIARLSMCLRKAQREQENLVWPREPKELPVVSWETFQRESRTRPLILIAGIIHDVSPMLRSSSPSSSPSLSSKAFAPLTHPGGQELLIHARGKDVTAAFFGGVYRHSNAAHNLLATMRVGVLHGGLEQVHPRRMDAPGRKLFVAETNQGGSREASLSIPKHQETEGGELFLLDGFESDVGTDDWMNDCVGKLEPRRSLSP